MVMSVNTNTGAMVALQNLTATNKSLEVTQNRINTGLNVASTKDDSASFSIAQTLRGDLGGLKAVTSSLNRAKSVTDVAVAGAEQISGLLNDMKAKAQQAADAGIDAGSRTAIQKDFLALKDQITTIINGSTFNGTNLLKDAGGSVTALQSIADGDSGTAGWQADSLSIANLGLDNATSGSLKDVLASTGFADASAAAAEAEKVIAAASTLNGQLSTLGAASRKIDAQATFSSKLADVIESGIGNLVDADLAKESAKLQALQVKQQLGLQALSIANQAPQSIVSLFR